ncbi:MAG: hypothetical protein IPK76_03970 [Lewinellaceae bacterium]|jgi:hypothetical protein|nr:hypothetical protein [Lewinellaceae bacterium]
MMKSILPGLLLVLFFTSCQKSQDEPIPNPGPTKITGTSAWVENGEDLPFQARSFALRLDKNVEKGSFSLTLSVLNQYNLLIQSLYFADIPFVKGNYALFKNITPYDSLSHAFFGYMEADLILKAYYVVEQDNTNFFSVDSLDAETGKVSGRFSVTMAHFQASTPAYPDTLYIRNGWYEATMNYR